ncbi:DUF3887 domain-containing protein [Dokdonella sp.]|uniref:DUF3887 domain-containing protein n=1 Tax=Dokdonella sp. TaxID=2291710 RepID=UPI0027B8D780|nr:DUF3887 domain-containing protein [Dokdonella sp.]
MPAAVEPTADTTHEAAADAPAAAPTAGSEAGASAPDTVEPAPAAPTTNAQAIAPESADDAARSLVKSCEARATALLDAAQKGDFTAATRDFDATMRSALPVPKFRAAWESLAQFGTLQARGQSHAADVQGYIAITIPLLFDKGNLYAQVACGSDGRIAGFYIKPIDAAAQ